MTVVLRVLTIHEFLLAYAEADPAEVERHSDRSMTVVSRRGTETITRCRTCPKEEPKPCTALRLLALPYASHPAYRPEWAIAPSDARAESATQSRSATRGGVVLQFTNRSASIDR